MKIFLTQRSCVYTLCVLVFTFVYSLFVPLALHAQSSRPLDQKITIQFDNVKLSEALSSLGQRLGYSFVYSNQLLHTEQRVTKKFTEQAVSAILTQLIAKPGLKYQVDGNQIYIGIRPDKKRQVSGIITAQGIPLAGASVRIGNSKTFAGQDGRYRLKVDADQPLYDVQISSMGYKTYSKKVEPKGDSEFVLSVELLPDAQYLDEVSVLGQTEIQKIKSSGFNVNALELGKYNNSTKDINQVLNSTTGVKIREYGGLGSDFNFSINGLSGKAVRFFVDGVPMENYGVGMAFNNIPVNLAERVEVYKGVVPIELGADALGGAVNLVTDKGAKSYLDASYSYGSFNTHRAAINAQHVNQKSGLLFRLTSFYNLSDNNYWMHSNPQYDAAIQVPDGQGGFVDKSVRRFHDQYRSAMVQGEVGYINKKWADVFVIGMLYNDHYKEYQTGSRQSAVYGKVNRNGDYLMPSIRYKKDDLFVQGLSATAFMSYGIDRYAVVDTSSTTYWWDGSIRSINNNHGEIGASIPQSHTNYKNTFLLGRLNLSYQLDPNNLFTFTQNYNSADQVSDEILSGKVFTPSGQSKSISGLSWQNKAFENRLQTEVFAKLFHFSLDIGEVVGGKSPRAAQKRDYNNYGFGLATRYTLSENIRGRFSYEHAYRLPELLEVLGDGVNVLPNPDIKPESSHNLNIGFDLSRRLGQHYYRLDAAGFFRDAKDFIYSIPMGNNSSQYLNEGKVRVYGGELEAQYKYADLLELTLNGSYQQSRQNQKYIYGENTPRANYGNLIPNQPWLYGNLFFSIGKNNWLGKDTRIQFDWYSQYIHEFYLTWEAWGSAQSLNVIPTQLLHHAGISYSLKEGRYNIAVESRNLTDKLAYDNYRLQKPGRSFNLKLRYYIH